MFYQLKDTLRRSWFNYQSRGILSTPPVTVTKNGPLIVSMVSHKDVIMYLIAIKSFLYHVKQGQAAVLDDGSLTFKDTVILKYHVPGIRLFHINDINTGTCPRRGCWERLLLISEFVRDTYVVQLDADTVASGDIKEVRDCITGNVSFAIGNEPGQTIQPMRFTCEKIKTWDEDKWRKDNPQFLAERNFDKLPDYSVLKYARIGASFTGFAPQSFSKEKVEKFSGDMEGLLGKKWHRWGSEQVTSNYVIANSPRVSVLPYPKYASYFPHNGTPYEESAFLHMIGANRFSNGVYIKRAKEIIERLERK